MRNNQRRAGQKPESAPISSVPTAHQPAPLAFSAPTEFVELPSRGEFYPEDHPFYKQEAIEIRFMTAKDEDILTSEALLKKNLAIDRLIENLVVEDIDTSSLLIGDRNAILIAARASAYGSDYEVTIRCEACSATAEANFDLKTARVQENCFDKEFLRENAISFNRETGTFDLSLPTSAVEVGLQLVDGKKEKKYMDKDTGKNLVTSLLSLFLVKVDGHMDYDSVMNFIDVMPAADSKFLRGLFPKLTPSVQLIKSHRCESCYTLQDVEVPLSAEFFWPK
jgi:hypothetical protein